jgi:uncharacterized protein YjbJ (UPF0337 family)
MCIPRQDEIKGTAKQGMGREKEKVGEWTEMGREKEKIGEWTEMGREKEKIGQWTENPDLEPDEGQRDEGDLQSGKPGRKPARTPQEVGERSRR